MSRALVPMMATVLVLTASCRSEPPSAAPLPESRLFVVDQPGTSYAFRDERVGLLEVRALEDVPLSKRAAVIVRSSRWPTSPATFVADLLEATPGEAHEAHARDKRYLHASSFAGEWAELRARLIQIRADALIAENPRSTRARRARSARAVVDQIAAESRHIEEKALNDLKFRCDLDNAERGGEVAVVGSSASANHLRTGRLAVFKPVVLYCVPGCAPCREAAETMAKRGIPFLQVNVQALAQRRELVEVARAAGFVPTRLPIFRVHRSTMQGFDASMLLEMAKN